MTLLKKGWISLAAALLLALLAVQDVSALNVKGAKSMSFNKYYTGKIPETTYEQVFKVSLPANGNLAVTVKTHQNASTWYLEVLNSKGEQVHDQYLKRKNGYQMEQVGLKKGIYYVVISGNKTVSYKIKSQFKKSEYYERELNDTVQKANSIKLGSTYYGALREFTDHDYFKFTLKKAKKVTVSYNNTPKEMRDLLIVNAKGKEYAKIHTNHRVTKSTTGKFTVSLKKGTYYLLVRYGGGSYRVKVQ